MNIGFGTGNLYKRGYSLKETAKLYKDFGADAIEISLQHWELLKLEVDEELKEFIGSFDYVSLHAPCHNLSYGKNKQTKELISKINYLSKKLNIRSIVVHPSIVEDFYALKKLKSQVLIENMDKRHERFTKPKQFKEFMGDYDFGFVLDVQHSFEHDSTMKLTKELIKIMGDRLKEIHLSGCVSKYKHFPVHISKNRKALEKFLKLKIKKPIILEGYLPEEIPKTAKREIEYVRSFYN